MFTNIHTVNNVNDNVIKVVTTNIDNDIVKDNTLVNSKIDMERSKEVEAIAQRLVVKTGSEDSWRFYCLIAYKLPEYKIWSNWEAAQSGRSPAALFNWLCRRDMGGRK